MKAAKPEDVNMEPVGFRITGILTDYVQELPGHCWVHPMEPKQPKFGEQAEYV